MQNLKTSGETTFFLGVRSHIKEQDLKQPLGQKSEWSEVEFLNYWWIAMFFRKKSKNVRIKTISCYWFLSRPLRISDNHKIFDISRGYRKRTVTLNGLFINFRDTPLHLPTIILMMKREENWLKILKSATQLTVSQLIM